MTVTTNAMTESRRRPLSPIMVLGGARTPFIKSFTSFDKLQADKLGELALRGALAKVNLPAGAIEEVVFGNVATPVHAANIARVIALGAGVPQKSPAHTVCRNCASGMESIVSAWQAMSEGRASVVAAGGVESMSNIPFQFNKDYQNWMIELKKKKTVWEQVGHLSSFRPNLLKPVVALQVGLTDPTCGLNMGETAEILAGEFHVSRNAQDELALASHQRTALAWDQGFLAGEVVDVVADGKTFVKDNGYRPQQTLEALAKLKPVFRKDGSVTAGNSSQLTDGASALILATEEAAQRLGTRVLGKIHYYTVVGLDPKRMGLGPTFAIDRLLKETGKQLTDFDLFEINEAFAAQVLACLEALDSANFCKSLLGREEPWGRIPLDKLNVHGGAIALGHPLGASGNRLVLTLLRALEAKGLRHGLAAMCIGGGQGMAMWVERVS
ncbi:thiolase family protein [Planctomicrobium sp. SH664]|uniref:thiolase family protein n=1 Tax=Planctomicrobium sp. SH664 TaxID=3448125 RepID=UPI003F5C6C3F